MAYFPANSATSGSDTGSVRNARGDPKTKPTFQLGLSPSCFLDICHEAAYQINENGAV